MVKFVQKQSQFFHKGLNVDYQSRITSKFKR